LNTDSAHIFLPGLITELQSPGLLSQLLMLAGCLLAGWWLSRWLVTRFTTPESWAGGNAPVDSFHRVLAPLLAVVLVAVSVAGLSRWQNVGTLRLALPLMLAFLLIRVLFFMLRKAFVKEGRVGRVLQSVEQIIAVIVWLGLGLYVTGLWPELVLLLEQTTLPMGRHRESLLVILQALISVAVTVVIALWASAVLEQRLMKFDAVHSSIRVVLARSGRALFLLLAVLISLSLVGIDLTVLSVFGGALGVGLGLGLQKLVSSYVSGMVILLERSLALGDIVSVDKYRGEVVQINARCTILRAGDGSEAVIPNEMMVSSPVQNFSLSDRRERLSSQLVVGYQTNIDEFATAARRAIQELPRVLAEPAPEVLISRLAQEGLVLEVSFWIADPEEGGGALLSEVNRRLLDLIRSLNVLIPPIQ
jgi:small-conductance mechanosensitive channel